MNILVTHAYSKENKGDAALLSVLLRDIRRAFADPHITLLTLEQVEEGETFEGVPVRKAFMNYARARYENILLQFLYAVFMAAATLLWAALYRTTSWSMPLPKHLREIVFLYRDADLIIPVGGGYILSNPGLINTVRLFFVLHPLWFGCILGKPTVNYSQSVGAFGSRFQEAMAKFTLKRVAGILVREKISLDLLERSWGLTNVRRSVDSGFSFESGAQRDLRRDLGISQDAMLIGVTVRKCLPAPAQDAYERAVAEFCDYAIRTYGASIVFIPQVTHEDHQDDDRESGKKVFSHMKEQGSAHLLSDRFDHHVIKAMYAGLDYLVGTRFHSVIFALTSYVPAIAIEYQYKTRGIMSDLGLEDWILDTRTIDADALSGMFDRLVASREAYLSHLKEALPPYVARSGQSIYLVKEIYEQYRNKHHAK